MKLLRFGAVVGLALLCVSCRSAGRRGVFLDLTVFEQNASAPVHDVLVWPVAQRNTELSSQVLQLMTDRLHKGVAGRQYSVLSRSLVEAQAKRLGLAEDAAIRATKETEGDAALVFRITEWDERGLMSSGRLIALGDLKLIGPSGKVLWQGRMRCDSHLVRGVGAPRRLEERRAYAAERLVEQVVARLPMHRVGSR